ncbi:clathrin adaptor complex small chain domain-containing protein [Rhizoctonia solani AG-1 IA]|uniref:Clathrin adaptor complex small chain domain-containing protein n=1 Tax=Thanatephorus cucumeris (strain AG1-IA) TaxID=983506 RepID=L8X9L2_THACA|nr:clathrin adaptor complex small chain domain-containing protein [Rhizoctonia solani AG-1 IA]
MPSGFGYHRTSHWPLSATTNYHDKLRSLSLKTGIGAGKVRLAKWYSTMSPKVKTKIVKDVTQLVLARRTRMCNFLEYKDTKVVYRRYASLFFVCGISSGDNELVTLEIIHRYVEVLDRYFGNVSAPIW